ncbi:MAG: hypothetical protein V4724_19825 [Pseudomonadota bacterium]
MILSSILGAARAALQWRLLMLWSGALLLPTVVLALPVWGMLGASLDYSVHAAELAQQLDLSTLADLMAEHGKNTLAFKAAALSALAITLLLSPLLTGAVVAAARAPSPLRLRALTAAGAAEYPRMLRMLLWGILPLGAALAAGDALRKLAGAGAALATLPTDGQYGRWAANGAAVLLFALACATLDTGRAALAADRRRTSAVKAWWRGLQIMRRYPLATLGAYAVLSASGLAVAGMLGLARIHVPHVGTAGFLAALALTQVIALVLAWMRSARLFALIDLSIHKK